MLIEKYYENPHILHMGTLPPRAYYIPCENAKIAMEEEPRDLSKRLLSLNGDWNFAYFESIHKLTTPLWEKDADRSQMQSVNVPSVWQTQGYDYNQYTNANYPFPCDPPYLPHDNPCGMYIRSFCLDETQKGYCSHLNFEGVDSCFYLWINGQFVGYSQVSHCTSEFDISNFTKAGENEIAVLVLKWCDGSYLEDQDKFRMSGIFRDVYILLRPKIHIWDYTVLTKLLTDNCSAEIDVSFAFLGESSTISYTLCAPNGDIVSIGQCTDKLKINVDSPILWNAEQPMLYTLVLETSNEVIAEKIGIREVCADGKVFKINGQRTVFRGVNRHDSDPFVGYAVDYNYVLKDLKLMKLHNINAIRTSHYPNSPYLVKLCDQLGFYICAEADVETHGLMSMYGCDADCFKIAGNPQYYEAWLDRVERLYERDKNRPCIVMWSVGNEAGYGPNPEAALKYLKCIDPTRLTHYENVHNIPEGYIPDLSNLDTISRMYAEVWHIEEYCCDPNVKKPVVLCEYSHAMGNSCGDLEEYQELVEKYDQFCGGFIWEWCDHAVYAGKTEDDKNKFYYGGDSGEFAHDGNFCMDGLVYPDRRVHTGLLEYKNVLRPTRITRTPNGKFIIKNTLDFLSLGDILTIKYEISHDGIVFDTRTLSEEYYKDIKPHKTGEFTLNLPQLSGKSHIRFIYSKRYDDGIVPIGYTLGFDQIQLSSCTLNTQPRSSPLTCPIFKQDDTSITIYGDNFCYLYNTLTGIFDELTVNDKPVITQPMEYNIWRAPIDNDRSIIHEWTACHYDHASARAYKTDVTTDNDLIIISTTLSISAISMQRFLTINVRWIIDSSGCINCCMDVRKNPAIPYLPRFGIRMFLPKHMDKVDYIGFGPYESYIDKHRASYYGFFSANVKMLHEDYIMPQENSSHYGCDSISIYGGESVVVAKSVDEPICFNASIYTQEQLTTAMHNYELTESDNTVLCLDYTQSGIGSCSCGTVLLDKYRLNKDEFTFKFKLRLT